MNNEEEEFEEKYKNYCNIIYRISIIYLKNKMDAEDVAQEVFIKLLHKAPKFDSAEGEKHWVIRVTINCCKNIIKSFWRKSVDQIDELTSVPSFTLEDIFNLNELLDLQPKYKDVVYLHYIEGYKIAEISQILNIKPSAVKMRLLRARDMLKICVEENNYE